MDECKNSIHGMWNPDCNDCSEPMQSCTHTVPLTIQQIEYQDSLKSGRTIRTELLIFDLRGLKGETRALKESIADIIKSRGG